MNNFLITYQWLLKFMIKLFVILKMTPKLIVTDVNNVNKAISAIKTN